MYKLVCKYCNCDRYIHTYSVSNTEYGAVVEFAEGKYCHSCGKKWKPVQNFDLTQEEGQCEK